MKASDVVPAMITSQVETLKLDASLGPFSWNDMSRRIAKPVA